MMRTTEPDHDPEDQCDDEVQNKGSRDQCTEHEVQKKGSRDQCTEDEVQKKGDRGQENHCNGDEIQDKRDQEVDGQTEEVSKDQGKVDSKPVVSAVSEIGSRPFGETIVEASTGDQQNGDKMPDKQEQEVDGQIEEASIDEAKVDSQTPVFSISEIGSRPIGETIVEASTAHQHNGDEMQSKREQEVNGQSEEVSQDEGKVDSQTSVAAIREIVNRPCGETIVEASTGVQQNGDKMREKREQNVDGQTEKVPKDQEKVDSKPVLSAVSEIGSRPFGETIVEASTAEHQNGDKMQDKRDQEVDGQTEEVSKHQGKVDSQSSVSAISEIGSRPCGETNGEAPTKNDGKHMTEEQMFDLVKEVVGKSRNSPRSIEKPAELQFLIDTSDEQMWPSLSK